MKQVFTLPNCSLLYDRENPADWWVTKIEEKMQGNKNHMKLEPYEIRTIFYPFIVPCNVVEHPWTQSVPDIPFLSFEVNNAACPSCHWETTTCKLLLKIVIFILNKYHKHFIPYLLVNGYRICSWVCRWNWNEASLLIYLSDSLLYLQKLCRFTIYNNHTEEEGEWRRSNHEIREWYRSVQMSIDANRCVDMCIDVDVLGFCSLDWWKKTGTFRHDWSMVW